MQAPTATAPALLAAVDFVVKRGNVRLIGPMDLHLHRGQLAWLGGPSGSGKTTLLLALARLLPAAGGELSLAGTPAANMPAPAWRSQVLLTPHPPLPLGPSVEQDLLCPFGLKSRHDQSRPTAEKLRLELAALGLEGVDLSQDPGQLSQGQLARLALIRAILAQPRVLLLDEPTANLDAEATGRVQRRVGTYCAQGGAAIVASHGVPWDAAAIRLYLAPRASGATAP